MFGASGVLMWHEDDVDNVHVERIGSSGDQLLKNVRCVSLRSRFNKPLTLGV